MSSFIYAQMAQHKQQTAQATPQISPGDISRLEILASRAPGDAPPPQTPPPPPPSNVAGYVEALSALIPAEVLTLHALILTATTKINSEASPAITTITDYPTMAAAFWGLAAMSMLLYLIPRVYGAYRNGVTAGTRWDKQMNPGDWARAFIPPMAFIAWTMLQRMTAFDAAFPSCSESQRTVIGLFLSAILVGAASWLAFKQPAEQGGN